MVIFTIILLIELHLNLKTILKYRDVAQPGSAPVLGTGGYEFKSHHLDRRNSSVG